LLGIDSVSIHAPTRGATVIQLFLIFTITPRHISADHPLFPSSSHSTIGLSSFFNSNYN
jgi:hypothetical protein